MRDFPSLNVRKFTYKFVIKKLIFIKNRVETKVGDYPLLANSLKLNQNFL